MFRGVHINLEEKVQHIFIVTALALTHQKGKGNASLHRKEVAGSIPIAQLILRQSNHTISRND